MDQIFPISFDTLALAVLGIAVLRKLARARARAPHRAPAPREIA
ncbi:hypothetical protein [Rhodobacter xanthinilyticus]|nr:hypothetical protein [Rhodobacter xanthinilyticus]